MHPLAIAPPCTTYNAITTFIDISQNYIIYRRDRKAPPKGKGKQQVRLELGFQRLAFEKR